MRTLTLDFAKSLLDATEHIQAFPASVQDILRLTREASCEPRELIEVIQRDPIVTIKVLRVINSAYYSLPRHISSVDHAVVLLGFNTIKNLALGIAALGMTPLQPHAAFSNKTFQRHSLACAAIVRRLGEKSGNADPNDYFIAGLLHDFGKLVVAQAMPGQFGKAIEYSLWNEVSLHRAILEVTGIDQAELGAHLLEYWDFPSDLVVAIRDQYAMDENSTHLAISIYAANQICKRIGADFASYDDVVPSTIYMERTLGGTLETIMESLGDLQTLFDEATMFSNL